MLLSELLDEERLGLRVLYAAPDAQAQPIGRLVTTDLLDPGRYLSGGELVLSGLVWHRSPGDSERFVRSVSRRGARALLAGGDVPSDLVEACRAHELTLIEVPAEVAFTDITEHIVERDSGNGHSRASASLVRQRDMLAAIAAGRSLDELADRVSVAFGHICRVLTPSGRHVVPGPAELDPATVDAVTAGFLTTDRLPAPIETESGTYSVFPVGSTLGQRLTTWLVVVDGDLRTWPRDEVDAVGELCAIASLDRSRRDESQRALRPIATEAVAMVEAGASQSEVLAGLRQTGLATDQPVVVVVVEISGSGPPEGAPALLEDIALTVSRPVVARTGDGRAVALLPHSPELPDLVRTACARFAPGLLASTTLSVGISGPADISGLAGALEEARFAHRVAHVGGTPVSVVSSEDVTSHALLLAAVPHDVRRTYATRVLGAVLEHDRRTRGDLVGTLSIFLETACSWARTADQLHLHVNSVRYRIDRIQELTGRDLSRFQDRVDMYLALKSL
ncbi:PucR family transcriptional regulator [Kribbella jiaozuonensis]|uniref:PucR family transcriptional regulator n=1 Tax=Kribbella jiaozuonensis TaxID=2575441 RepID=A0A4U3M1M8_9ACTN|nr:helix-turn-helix domain-containing protein [Kribbella jiaozuonensis]TKK81889.1 PucR family transcriptional regulator [Kribbella jiaozuonensis]